MLAECWLAKIRLCLGAVGGLGNKMVRKLAVKVFERPGSPTEFKRTRAFSFRERADR
jgi:hypothetical protein